MKVQLKDPKKINPKQQQLIESNVTLFREEEITNMDKVLDNLQNLDTSKITIQFGQAIRFDHNKSALFSASCNNRQFHQVREKVLTSSNI